MPEYYTNFVGVINLDYWTFCLCKTAYLVALWHRLVRIRFYGYTAYYRVFVRRDNLWWTISPYCTKLNKYDTYYKNSCCLKFGFDHPAWECAIHFIIFFYFYIFYLFFATNINTVTQSSLCKKAPILVFKVI